MRFLRRVASAILLAALFVSGLRLSGHRVTPPQRGGWRPLELPDADRSGLELPDPAERIDA